jgi:endonuclease G, mitochondrial
MKTVILASILILATNAFLAQDSSQDISKTNIFSVGLRHLADLFTIHGVPKNQNSGDTLELIVNHGYCLGFSKKYNQPLWAAYQVSKSKEQTDYERPLFFADDVRLPEKNRIGSETYGDGYDLGHMVPNAAINKQYGKLAQMETFLMSNVAPQTAGLNRGVWAKLEAQILEKYCYKGDTTISKQKHSRDHIWVIVGPIFGENPNYLTRKNGSKVAIAESFFCIIVRPFKYDYDVPTNAEYLSFIFPQTITQAQKITKDFFVSINEIEAKTKLNFFPNFTKHYEAKVENTVPTKLW